MLPEDDTLRDIGPLVHIQRTPELQAALQRRFAHCTAADAAPFLDDLAQAREVLPELAFLSDAALARLIADYSKTYWHVRWEYPSRGDDEFGAYALGRALRDELDLQNPLGPGKSAMAAYQAALVNDEGVDGFWARWIR